MAGLQLAFDPFGALHHIGADIAVGEHRTFGHAGGTAGVLQKGQIFARQRHFLQCLGAALRQRAFKGYGVRDAVVRHLFAHAAQHEINQSAFEKTEHIADAGNDNVFDLGARQHHFQRIGKVFQHHDGGGAAVFELVFEFARGVERVGIDHHQPGLQDAEYRNRVLQQIGHHHRHPLAARQLEHVLQIGCEIGRQLGGLAVADFYAHAVKGGFVGKLFDALFEYVHHRLVAFGVDLVCHAVFVAVQPDFFHGLRFPLCGRERGRL